MWSCHYSVLNPKHSAFQYVIHGVHCGVLNFIRLKLGHCGCVSLGHLLHEMEKNNLFFYLFWCSYVFKMILLLSFVFPTLDIFTVICISHPQYGLYVTVWTRLILYVSLLSRSSFETNKRNLFNKTPDIFLLIQIVLKNSAQIQNTNIALSESKHVTAPSHVHDPTQQTASGLLLSLHKHSNSYWRQEARITLLYIHKQLH